MVLSNTINLLLMAAFSGMIFVLTLYLQNVRHLSALTTGLTLAPSGIAGMLGGAGANALSRRFGAARVLSATSFVEAVAIAALVALPGRGTIPFVIACTVFVSSFGVVAIVMINIAATSFVEPERQGVASGLLNTTRQIGGALGVAVATAAIGAVASLSVHERAVQLGGYRRGLVISAAAVLAASLLSLAKMRPREPLQPAIASERDLPVVEV